MSAPVFVAAHGVGLALRQARAQGAPVSRLEAIGRHVEAMERVTGSLRAAARLRIRWRAHDAPASRILGRGARAMGTRRQRALAREGISAADVVGIARTNAGLMLATNVVLTAAGERGLVDKAELATRISPWLEATVSAWVALAQESWQESRLTTPQPRADLETLAAGSQLHL